MARRLRVRECPTCHTLTDSTTSYSETRPSPGDWSVCAYCSAINRYTDELGLRSCNDAEQRIAETLPDVQAALVVVAAFRERSGRR